MTLPNLLTFSRIFLTLLFVVLMTQNGLFVKALAAVVFFIASLTDLFDGYYAKKYNLITNWGKLMDPIADKFLVLTVFFIFAQMHLIALWMFIVILAREIIVTGMRLAAVMKGKVLAAEKAGKYKTAAQITAISITLLFIVYQESPLFNAQTVYIVRYWQYGIFTAMITAVVLTLTSGVFYIRHNLSALRG